MASTAAFHGQGPPRNPTPLSFAQESQVRELYHKRVRAKCATEIRDFAACAMNRTVTVVWSCRAQRREMNACMIQLATREEEDAARLEWWATRGKRAAEYEAKERQRKEQEKFHNEWWGLTSNAPNDEEPKGIKEKSN